MLPPLAEVGHVLVHHRVAALVPEPHGWLVPRVLIDAGFLRNEVKSLPGGRVTDLRPTLPVGNTTGRLWQRPSRASEKEPQELAESVVAAGQ